MAKLSDAEIAKQLEPFFAEIDKDYDSQVEPMAKAFLDKPDDADTTDDE